MGDTAAELVQQALGRQAAVVQAGQVTAPGGQKYSLIAVRLLDAV